MRLPIGSGANTVGIIRVQGSRLNRDYLTEYAPLLDVADLLARTLQEGG